MTNKKLILLLLLLLPAILFAQEPDSTKTSKKEKSYTPLILKFKPTIGLGVGMFTFYGDIANNHQGYHPTVSRIGYALRVTNPITDYIDISFYAIFGKVGANERTTARNLNFESNITTGGLSFYYNFKQLLREDRVVDPYFMVGIESFEFLSKTDLYDTYGNTYYYWSDGSIRNLPELPGNEAISTLITRDYSYESDVRESNVDGFGKYAERSWAMPVGIGANFHLNDRLSFKIGTEMHFTFTDYVDGVTDKSIGARQGDSKNDKFLFTSFNLNYDLILQKPNDEGIDRDELNNYLLYNSFDLEDTDGDHVEDFKDRCPNTPTGVVVNEYGCPADTDGDTYPDFKDDEINTPTELVQYVNNHGVAKSDDEILNDYLLYLDSGYATTDDMYTIVKDEITSVGDPNSANYTTNYFENMSYVILVGDQTHEVTANDLAKLLAYKNFKSYQKGGTIFYVLDGYKNIDEAAIDKYKLSQEDLNAITSIASEVNNGSDSNSSNHQFTPVNNNQVPDVDPNSIGIEPDKELVLRVQIGAFSRPISTKVFAGVPELVFVKGADGLYRYYTGAFTKKEDAAKHKVKMVLQGYTGAFIVAYENGERKTLNDVGFDVIKGVDDPIKDKNIISSVNKDKVKFRIQVGAYANAVPTAVLDKFLEIGNISPNRGADGVTRYVSTIYETHAEASAAIEKIREIIEEAFIVGDFNGNIIPVDEADKLLQD